MERRRFLVGAACGAATLLAGGGSARADDEAEGTKGMGVRHLGQRGPEPPRRRVLGFQDVRHLEDELAQELPAESPRRGRAGLS